MRPLASTPSKICKERVFSQVATFLPFLLVFQGFFPLLAHWLRIPWEDRFQAVVAALGSDNEDAKVGAAIMLRTFLQPGYERFYRQAFYLAVAHLRLRKPDLETIEEDTKAPVLASLNQALIVIFEEAFSRAREWVKQGSPSSRLQRVTAWLKRILRREKRFDPRSLDARYIQL